MKQLPCFDCFFIAHCHKTHCDNNCIIPLLLQAGNTALHEAVRNNHISTVKLLMSADCRVNVRNEQGLTPIEIAGQERNNELVTQLSGLQKFYNDEDELRQLLFQDNKTGLTKKAHLKKLRWSDSQLQKKDINKMKKKSESMLRHMEQIWKDRVDLARSEVLAHCQNRIAEVEKQCQAHVARIERQCCASIEQARQQYMSSSDDEERTPSAPPQQQLAESNYKYSVLSLP